MVDYTDNIPQGNQKIATTQPLIQANFGYLKSAINQEHNFDAVDATKTYHLQASMPNKALSPAVPVGTNGVYFISGGNPYFYDGTTNSKLNPFQEVITGTFNTPSSSSNFTIASIPANVFGIVYFYRIGTPWVGSGQFVSDASNVYGFSNQIVTDGLIPLTGITLINDPTSTNVLRAFCSTASFQNKTYNYVIFYRPV